MKFLKILYVQVILGIILGILTGWLFPGFAGVAKLISDTFINMIRMVIAPVIFLTIVSGIAGAGNLGKVGRVGLKALIYFELVTPLALIIGVDRFMSEGRAIVNFIGNTVAAVVIAKSENEIDMVQYRRVVEKK